MTEYPPATSPSAANTATNTINATKPGGGFFARLGRGLESARFWAANLIFLLIVGLLVLTLSRGCSTTTVPPNAALVLSPQGVVVEASQPADPIQGLLSGESDLTETEIRPLVQAVKLGADDPNIKLLVLRLNDLAYISTAHAKTLGAAIEQFREAGKSVTSYAYAYSETQYLLASYADAVYLHPLGEMVLAGTSRYSLYFKDLLDKLNVNVHVFRVGTYKSFVEPYLRNDMSPADREASTAMIQGLWDAYAQQVAENRGLSVADINAYLTNIQQLVAATGGDMARVALEAKLVDELLSEDQIRVRISDTVGLDAEGNINGIDHQDYLASRLNEENSGTAPYITVITAQGQIVMRGGMPGTMAADNLARLIRLAKEDKDSAGLVVRVDSPGGSAFASELIRQELELYQLSGRPVVTSMGNVAASGGYWIASTSDAIFAEPTTITGSIGIFGQLPTFENSLAMLGVHSDGVSVGPLEGGGGVTRGISPTLSAVIQQSIEQGYDRFINLVARGRDLPLDAVRKVAEGRVWLGSQALELGLVDANGNLQDAIDGTRKLIGKDSLGVRYIAPELSPRQQLLRLLLDESGLTDAAVEYRQRRPATSHVLSQLTNAAQQWLDRFDDPGHRYLLCTLCRHTGY